MKKILLLCTAAVIGNINAQEVIFSQDFEDTATLADWSVTDLDGDGNNWEFVYSSDQAEAQGWGPDMTLMAGSFAYNLLPGQEGPLTPDNILATPGIEIPAEGTTQLDFKLGTNVDYMNNHNFALYVVENFTEFDATWTPFYSQNFSGISTAQDISLDLTEFAGTSVSLVFRHYDSDEQFVLLMDDIVITNTTSMSTTDIQENFNVAVYPNPTQDVIYVKSTDAIQQLNLFDAKGSLLKSEGNTSSISLKELPKGIYFLRIKTETETFSKKVVKE